jgi:hypothetical protein
MTFSVAVTIKYLTKLDECEHDVQSVLGKISGGMRSVLYYISLNGIILHITIG